MTQKQSSKNEETPILEERGDEFDVAVEDEQLEAAAPKEKPEPEPDSEAVTALKKQLEDLQAAQEGYRARERDAQLAAQQAAQQLNTFRTTAAQSQYDSIVTAMGAAEMETEAAKRDIVVFGHAQDYEGLALAQERLAAAKSRMVNLELAKDQYERAMEQQPSQPQQPPRDPVSAFIDHNPSISYEEKMWLRQHPDALTDNVQNTKLNAAYFHAMDKGLQRGSREYFDYIEEQLGYRQPTVQEPKDEESALMPAAPPSKSTPGTSASGSQRFTMTKEEADIAKAAGITPAEYVKQREHLKQLKKQGHYNQ